MRRILILMMGVILLAPSAAYAQAANGAFPDPASPPGKEYALPLDAARSVGLPSNRSPAVDSTTGRPVATVAFGTGIDTARTTDAQLLGVAEVDRGSRIDAGGSALIVGLAGLAVLLAAMGSAGLRRSPPTT